MKYRESKVPTVEAIHAIDYSSRIETADAAAYTLQWINHRLARYQVVKVSKDNTKARELVLEEDLAENVSSTYITPLV